MIRAKTRNSATATQLARNVIAVASEDASGITSGGNAMRRIVGPLETIDGSVAVTASAMNVYRTMPISR